MNPETFSQKEILLQLMSKMDAVSHAVNKQELLLTTINEASASRDEKIKELKTQVVVLENKVEELSDKVEALKSFNKTLLAFWSFVVLVVSLFGKEIFNKIF